MSPRPAAAASPCRVRGKASIPLDRRRRWCSVFALWGGDRRGSAHRFWHPASAAEYPRPGAQQVGGPREEAFGLAKMVTGDGFHGFPRGPEPRGKIQTLSQPRNARAP